MHQAHCKIPNMTAAAIALVCFAGPALAQVPADVRQYRHHMFDPEVSTMANRTFELMFDTARVEAGDHVWQLPVSPTALDFSYEAGGTTIAASDFAERTFTDALLIMKGGMIVHEQYFNYANETTHFNSYSMAKTFNSIMVGAALADGLLPSIDVPVTDYMPELAGTAYDGLALKHILQMRSGVAWDDNFFVPGPSRDAHVAAFVDNTERYVSHAQKIKTRGGTPGTQFNYNSIEAALAGEIVSRSVGKSLSVYLSEKLWKPAGMQSYAFYALDGPAGIGKEFTAGAFNAVLRDYGRVAQMMLNGGMANGQRILPQAWVEESTTPGPGFDGSGRGYAYLWWTLENTEAFFMLGGEGQYVFVDPATETVVVKLSHIPVGEQGTRAGDETLAFLRAVSAWQP